ncbi:S-adenosyl-L-methionine-dependent methyltransferase [Pseudoneurospora amorphoporcata]|uniref:tRNA wybutosine-synthesizing protein 2 n=1 Tax=Pseudoneurospora amorphoporcata TaxID=241081 RepID=A0AAN6SIT2_9PEZI|nr:S-adenosyl-L-methionine-dependent methyltransferase [Pseudoneurospora amorphoporcata]
MVLLPSGSFTSSPWPQLLASLSSEVKSALWIKILANITRDGGASKVGLSRLAVNEGIPLLVGEQASKASKEEDEENLLRSPSGLKMLHGDFGPALSPTALPTEKDFDEAFWVSTKQNGITQIWAPRYTMFSRGNVKEKARLLDFHRTPAANNTATTTTANKPSSSPASISESAGPINTNTNPEAAPPQQNLTRRVKPSATLKGRYALDLYAGIGYFVFSYAKLGMRVLCWEINPWSVEGLRRGALANKWTVKVFQGTDLTERTTVQLLKEAEGVQIVVFLEGNESAGRRVRELREGNGEEAGRELDVLHVNGGFLPTSEKSWRDSWEAVVGKGVGDGWLHLHENVHVKDIESRRGEIQGIMNGWNQELDTESSGGMTETKAVVEHVELVKTFAPDVWHCVFDVYITRCSTSSSSGGGSRPT